MKTRQSPARMTSLRSTCISRRGTRWAEPSAPLRACIFLGDWAPVALGDLHRRSVPRLADSALGALRQRAVGERFPETIKRAELHESRPGQGGGRRPFPGGEGGIDRPRRQCDRADGGIVAGAVMVSVRTAGAITSCFADRPAMDCVAFHSAKTQTRAPEHCHMPERVPQVARAPRPLLIVALDVALSHSSPARVEEELPPSSPTDPDLPD